MYMWKEMYTCHKCMHKNISTHTFNLGLNQNLSHFKYKSKVTTLLIHKQKKLDTMK
jgi:hypothetical protein